MIIIPEKRTVLFEKLEPRTIIHNLFLEHLSGCKIMAIGGGEVATDFYLAKNDNVLFELNRMSKIIFIMSDIIENIMVDAYKFKTKIYLNNLNTAEIKGFELELFESIVSKIIKDVLKIDIDYDYTIKITSSGEQEECNEHMLSGSTEVKFESLLSPSKDMDKYIDSIMFNLFKTKRYD